MLLSRLIRQPGCQAVSQPSRSPVQGTRAAMDPSDLIATLAARFAANPRRHPGTGWSEVLARLKANPRSLPSLAKMEQTGGEPDVIGRDAETGRIIFCDCAPESPSGRRSLCFDRAALEARKENKPRSSAQDMAADMGVDLLTEAQYRHLQTLGAFDCKTSSWIATPSPIRTLGGALFCDRRYGAVFVYHNGAESYYAARGFRGRVLV